MQQRRVMGHHGELWEFFWTERERCSWFVHGLFTLCSPGAGTKREQNMNGRGIRIPQKNKTGTNREQPAARTYRERVGMAHLCGGQEGGTITKT
jgi:hypothetical protein